MSVRYHLDLRDDWTDLLETWYTNNLMRADDARIFEILIFSKLADWRPFLFGKKETFLHLHSMSLPCSLKWVDQLTPNAASSYI